MGEKIDPLTWKRNKHYEAFMQMSNPHFSICSQINISKLIEAKTKLFPSILFAIHEAAESIEEFRMRTVGADIVLYESLDVCFNVMAKDGLFSNHRMPVASDLETFMNDVNSGVKKKSIRGVVEIDPNQNEAMVLTSFIPWMSFSSLSEPTFSKYDSIPRVTWGKCDSAGNIPVSVQVHHALMDGVHVAEFFKKLSDKLNSDFFSNSRSADLP